MHRPKGDDTAEPTQAATISLRFVFSDKYDIFQNGWEYWLPDRRELPTEFQNSDLYMGKKPKNKNGDLSPENKIKIDIKISSQYLDLFSMTVSSNETKIIRIYPAEEEDFGCRDDNVALEIFSTPIGEKLKDLAKRHGKFEGSNISYKSPCKIGFAPLRLRSHIDESSAFEQDLLSIANHVLDCLRFYTYALPNVNSDRGTIYNSQLVSFQSFSKRQRPHTPRLTKSPSLACEALSDLTSGIIAHLSEAKFAERRIQARSATLIN